MSPFRLTAVLLLTTVAFAGAAEAVRTKTVRLLNIGNSFSRNATQYLDELAAAAGHTLVHYQASIGGSTLQQHWEKAQRHEKNPEDPAGFYSTKLSLKQELRAEPWDYVTIQQASIKSHDLATYRPFAALLRDYVKQHAPGAELLIHQTWAYRSDDVRFSPANKKAGEPLTQQAMHEQLTSAYRTIAKELGIRIIPTGDAFHLADTHPQWGYVKDPKPFDRKTAKPGELPNQHYSLHVGWFWRKEKDGSNKIIMDGHHAGTAGEYLGSCVFYEVLFGESVVGNPYVPAKLDPKYAAFLQETAHAAVVATQSR